MKIISGGQTGADQAGLLAGKYIGFETGGTAPKDYMTLEGPNLDLKHIYNLSECTKFGYAARTAENVKFSDCTIRLAKHFNSPGEKCTLNAIKKYNKPYLDIDMNDPINPHITAMWIMDHKFKVINIAGNAERPNCIMKKPVFKYLVNVFIILKENGYV